MTEIITIKWKGEYERYSSYNWCSPRAKAFLNFLHGKEDKILSTLYKRIYNWIGDIYEKPLFMYDGNTRTSDERMNLSISGAEKMFREYLSEKRNKTFRFSLYREFNIGSDYDPEYDAPTKEDFILDNIADMIGWNIYDNSLDHQRMSIAMHMETNGSLKYNWYMKFRIPDFLDTFIDLDSIFDKAAEEVANYNVDDYE